MSDTIRRIRAAQIRAAEDEVIRSIPQVLLDNLRKANEELRAAGGCKGCGSMVFAVHNPRCPELANDLY